MIDFHGKIENDLEDWFVDFFSCIIIYLTICYYNSLRNSKHVKKRLPSQQDKVKKINLLQSVNTPEIKFSIT